MADKLSKAQCILLAVNYASESQIRLLQQLYITAAPGQIPEELVLRILLTYLPTVTPPDQYTHFVQELVLRAPPESSTNVVLDLAPLKGVSAATADKKLRKLTLLPLKPPQYPADAPGDELTRFVCHRAYRIDEETGLLTLISALVAPFLQTSEYLRLWYLSAVLPLLRFRHDYYPDLDVAKDILVSDFERYNGRRGTALLLSGAKQSTHEIVSDFDATGTIARDLKGLVGPWLYGHTRRKRRRLNGGSDGLGDGEVRPNGDEQPQQETDDVEYTWESVYSWLVHRAVNDFATAAAAVEHWDGPSDVELGDVAEDLEEVSSLEQHQAIRRYGQSAFAMCYAVEDDSPEAIAGAHGILVRLAQLLDFEPPPDLATSVEQLPRIDTHMAPIDAGSQTLLSVDNLLKHGHAFTIPEAPAFMLLQMLVYSAYQFSGLHYSVSVVNVAKLRFFSTVDEQLKLLRRILKGLSQGGKRDEHQWRLDRSRLLWLWNWSIDPDEPATTGSGPLGDISRPDFEKEILVKMLATGNYTTVKDIYFGPAHTQHRLSFDEMEESIIGEAIKTYDSASNGNRTRGGIKKASEIINTFSPLYPNSTGFQRVAALITATHAMSYYTLILQHGIPFQPVNIRVAPDPLLLLEQILEQNAKSYTKLDDLISIGRNLAIALPSTQTHSTEPHTLRDSTTVAEKAERRVVYMCISSALEAHDFDTAYSYLINRLSPASSIPTSTLTDDAATVESDDDISWRAALLAGRYRPAPSNTEPDMNEQIRRLEQRTELLSLALRMAPLPALTEILNVYRRCEEEMSSLLSQRVESEAEHEDILSRQRGGGIGGATAGNRDSGAGVVPGGFGALGVDEGRVYGQSRREVGRLSGPGASEWDRDSSAASSSRRGQKPHRDSDGGRRSEEQAPVGLFDLASGAAAALRRNAFPLRRGPVPTAGSSTQSSGPGTPAAAPSAQARGKPAANASYQGSESAADAEGEEEDWGAEWGGDSVGPSATDAHGRLGPSAGDDGDEAWGWNDDQGNVGSGPGGGGWGEDSMHSTGSTGAGPGEPRSSAERVRRRDVVANAVTGSLVSGIGWVLGATPQGQGQGQEQGHGQGQGQGQRRE